MSLTSAAVTTIEPPTNLSATTVSDTEIDLDWTASQTSGITGYHVYRNGGGSPIATVNAPTTAYDDTGLNPGTFYTYTVTAFDATDESDPSNQASATTTGGGGSVTIAAAGDIACHPNDEDYNNGLGQNGHCAQASTAALIGQGSYDKVLALGDEQYDCGSLAAFNASYDPTWGQYNSKVEPVLGNHEVKGSSGIPQESGCSKNATGYFSYFANHGVGDAAGINGKGYYSYDLGAWHILAIDANCTFVGGCDTGSAEESWVRSDLAAHANQCTLAYWHQAPWSTTGSGGVANMRTIWKDLVNADAELVLVGHFHHYERFADLNANGQPVADGTGTREIIAGIGGESQGSFSGATPLPGSQVRKMGYGILAVALNSGSYSWQYKQVGVPTPADSGSDTCH
jgi:chitodextrinase